MWLLLVPVCLAIFSSSLSTASEPHYVITVPVNLLEGTQEKACVTFLDLKTEVDLKLELKHDDQAQTITECKISTHDHTECYPFQVPHIKEHTSVWQLHASVHGENIDVDKSSKVVIVKTEDVCIIQTDKSTYKPGDIVHFRVMSVNPQFLPINRKYPLVEILDTQKNRIAQWLDPSTDHGFADFSFHLGHELHFGEYKINIPNGCDKYFKVGKYELKRWELKMDAPSEVFVEDKSIHVEVCGSYIYGEHIEGKVDLSVCIKHIEFMALYYYKHGEEDEEEEDEEHHHNCTIIKGEKTDSKGCVSKDIQLDFDISELSHPHRISYIDIDAKLTEDNTGHSEKENLDIYLRPNYRSIRFLDPENLYNRGFPYHGRVQVEENRKPLANEAITIAAVMEDDSNATSVNVVTDSNGIAQFTIDTTGWADSLSLRARLASYVPPSEDSIASFEYTPQDWISISLFYSNSDSLLHVQKHPEEVPCHSDQSVVVEYEIDRKNLDSDTDHLHFFYIILTKSGIYSYKEHDVDIKGQESHQHVSGSFSVNFHVEDDFFPIFNILIFSVLPNGETVADTTTFNVPPCSQSKVKLSFSEEQVRPGEEVHLEITADADSVCSVRSVDKGYLVNKPHDDSSLITMATEILRNSIQYNEYSQLSKDPEEHQCSAYTMRAYDTRVDVFSLFEKSHLKVITNSNMKIPVKCIDHEFVARSATVKKTERKDNEKEIQKRFTRSNFPEVWLFDLVHVDSDGHTTINRTVPDTITKWSTDAVCLGKSGFTSVQDVELTAFQSYFIDLIIPHSVVQGEKFTIQAVVFNYAKKCSLIAVSLSDSEDLITVHDKEQAKCVCEGHSHSFTWDVSTMKPKKLKIHVESGSIELESDCKEDVLLIGKDVRKDAVEKTLEVKPKGYLEADVETFLLLPSEKREPLHITLKTPERLVPGSEDAHLIISGDIMANAAINVDDVLRMPDGCGEQNSAKMLRIANVLDYLKHIHELTPEQKAKSLESLVESYQKQLTLRTENGSFAMFLGGHENIWVTAYTINALSAAKEYIYINEIIIQKAVEWLHGKQSPDGCFRIEQDYFNNYIDEEDHVMFTVYVALSLLEHHVVYNGSIAEDTLKCLRNSIEKITTDHNRALLAYVFTLSEDNELRDQLLKKLDEKAVREGNMIHWESSQTYGDTETASYVILALLSGKVGSLKILEECTNMVRWLLTQQNPWGGFGSTQDTTIALEAMAQYARAINNKKGDATLTITSKSGFQKTVHVDKSNCNLVQIVDLPEIPGEYTVEVEGDGVVYLQSHEHYHALPEKKDNEPFSFNVTTEPSTCTHASEKRFDIHVDVSYTGKRESTNMVLIMFEHVSGYVPDKESVKKLEKHSLVERIEVTAENMTIYLTKLCHEIVSFTFTMEQEAHVENLAFGVAAVLDYYDHDEHDVVAYSPPCHSAVAHCAVAADEREDCGFPKISKDQCEEKGCCYDTSIHETKWCFFQGYKKTEEH